MTASIRPVAPNGRQVTFRFDRRDGWRLPLFQNRAAGLLIALILAVGLTATGFAHRVPSQSEQMQQMVVAMGGSIHDLCGDTTDGRQGDCPACRLVNFVTPEPVGLRLVALGTLLVLVIPVAARSPPMRRVRDPACGVRGPPSV